MHGCMNGDCPLACHKPPQRVSVPAWTSSGFALLFKVDASNVANHEHDRPFPKLESTAIAAIIEDLSAASATVDALPSPAVPSGGEAPTEGSEAPAGAGGPTPAAEPMVDAAAGGCGRCSRV